MATTSNPELSLSRYFPLVEYELPDGEKETTIDFFNPDGARFVDNLEQERSFVWNSSLRLDVLAYRQFGTVSAWWLPLFFDGAQHVSELRTGSAVAVPRPVTRLETSRARSPGRGSRITL